MNQPLEAGVTVDANNLVRQRDAERFDVLPGASSAVSRPAI
jgi:hypothetical protein